MAKRQEQRMTLTEGAKALPSAVGQKTGKRRAGQAEQSEKTGRKRQTGARSGPGCVREARQASARSGATVGQTAKCRTPKRADSADMRLEEPRKAAVKRDTVQKEGDRAACERKRGGAARVAQSQTNTGAKRKTVAHAGGKRPKHRDARQSAAMRGSGRDKAERQARAARHSGSITSPKRRKSKGQTSAGRSHSGRKAVEAKRGLYASLCLLFATGIACMLLMGIQVFRQHDSYMDMKRVVESQTFYAGTSVEGLDVSGLTLAQALEYWRARQEPKFAGRAVTVDDGTTLTAEELGYSSDYESVLTNAWSAGRSGSLEARYAAAVQRNAMPMAYTVNRTMYDERSVNEYVQTQMLKINQPARNAAVASFDLATYKFQFTESSSGAKLNAEALKRDIEQTLEAGGGSVIREIEVLEPSVTTESMTGNYGMVAYAVTNASSSSKNRLSNIRQALSYINGTCLEPGEVFSFNKVVGRRTTQRGFKVATAYSSGDVTEEVGGGICQVSTTLFNAAVKADLGIVERHNHSLTVGYVDSGKDATVNWDSQDLRFRNTTGDKIYICCYLTGDKRVRVGIFGKQLANGETITVEAQTTQVIKFDTVYEPSGSLASGQTKVISNGKNGCKAIAYKVRWDANGREISREVLCKSAYKAKNQVVAYGA